MHSKLMIHEMGDVMHHILNTCATFASVLVDINTRVINNVYSLIFCF